MTVYLLQQGDWMRKEKMAVTMPDLPHLLCTYENLFSIPKDDYIPVGTVEYTTKYAELNDIKLPENITYPSTLDYYLKRLIYQDTFKNVQSNLFVKPLTTKTFTGDIKSKLTEYVNPDETVWVSETINLINEYRYYIIDHTIAGYSRYDSTDNEDIIPDPNVIQSMITDYTDQPIGYCIDVGIIDKNETVLVEVNDGWSLGLYPWGNMTREKYVELITRRWKEIISTI